ncbi:uracil-DNA glycosylase [Microbacterium sp. C7(2022)]|uniref:uracil-DNA glycosylase n=1 Tax=Microbacterium sp. C7(2022) TaxID=2992759 RepID=UPI00237B2422|nr:uracil-DNA glycosylase [Microbacterium sp. C7(2022)]MDE0547261.1 uracil-DNA glycosylase [Microbacterium sp. C7(2022)]
MPDVLSSLVDEGRVDAGWGRALAPLSSDIDAMYGWVRAEGDVLPREENIMRAFREPIERVRVLIVGQDPYPTPGHAIGLSFAVDRDVRPLPPSLRNIYAELESDLGVPRPAHGDLSAWSAQGVLLLNRVLTVAPGAAGSHRRRGWEQVTAHAIRALAQRGTPLVAILWGKDAADAGALLAGVPVIASAHPSPLSARRGFFGSRPFSRANDALIAQGAEPIDWHAVASA